jgi:ubiquitin C-terminal hydrolase
MKYINNTFILDYIIEADISLDNNNDNKVFINKIKVYKRSYFNEANVPLSRNVASVNESYLKYPHFQLLINNKNKMILNQNISNENNENLLAAQNSEYSFNENMSYKSFNLESYKKINISPIGLKNPSIYCYMNCCLQILLSIPELNYFFLYKKYKESEENKALICDDFSNFIALYAHYEKNKQSYMELPRTMFDISNTLVQRGLMNDCEEFLFQFLKSMQEELNIKNKFYRSANEDESIQKRWCLYREVNSSFIDSMFTGFIRSTVICNQCNNSSFNYEPFMNLSVPIPKSNKSVKKCLNIYFEIENINCDYHCDNCKRSTNVSM